jgi:hypothetical protein
MMDYRKILQEHLPEGSVDMVNEWLDRYAINLRLSPLRHTKLGTYHPPRNTHPHYITVNRDLHRFTFLIILIHEIAHAVTWERYQNRVRPHGSEWKSAYKNLMEPLLEKQIFPDDISLALKHYLDRAYASIVTDLNLTRILQTYQTEAIVLLEDVPVNTIFRVSNGRMFKKKEKLRKRIRCVCLNTHRSYLFNPITQIIPVDN